MERLGMTATGEELMDRCTVGASRNGNDRETGGVCFEGGGGNETIYETRPQLGLEVKENRDCDKKLQVHLTRLRK